MLIHCYLVTVTTTDNKFRSTTAALTSLRSEYRLIYTKKLTSTYYRNVTKELFFHNIVPFEACMNE